MSCKYSYYKDEDVFFPRLYCKSDNGICIGSKRCDLKEKFVPLENYNIKSCFKYIMAEEKNIPKGSNYISTYRINKKGFLYLYVVIGDHVERIETQLKEIDQQYIYLKKNKDSYDISLVPFNDK